MCSTGGNYQHEDWVIECDGPDAFRAGLRSAMHRPPKWTLVDVVDDAAEGVTVFRCDRMTDKHHFIDNITLRVAFDGPRGVRVDAHSRCGNPKHTYDWGQNKRNLKQLAAALQSQLPGLTFKSKK